MLSCPGGAHAGEVLLTRRAARQLRQQAGVAKQRDEQHLRRLRAMRVVAARRYLGLLEHPGAGAVATPRRLHLDGGKEVLRVELVGIRVTVRVRVRVEVGVRVGVGLGLGLGEG